MIYYNGQVLPLCSGPAVHFSSTILLNLKINVHSCDADSEGDMCERQGEPSNRDIMKVLQNMNISLNTKLDLLNDTVES